MQNIALRAKSLRLAMGLTQQKFSERIGVTRGYISQIEAGVVRVVGPGFLAKLDVLEKAQAVSQVAKQRQSQREETTETNVAMDPLPKSRKIPILSEVQAGMAMDYETMPDSWEDTEDYTGTDPKAYALRVTGNSMAPDFPPGTVITISPQYPPANGHHVVAAIKGEGALFKIFHHSGDNKKVTLTSYNPAFPPLVHSRDDFHFIHRVVFAKRVL